MFTWLQATFTSEDEATKAWTMVFIGAAIVSLLVGFILATSE